MPDARLHTSSVGPQRPPHGIDTPDARLHTSLGRTSTPAARHRHALTRDSTCLPVGPQRPARSIDMPGASYRHASGSDLNARTPYRHARRLVLTCLPVGPQRPARDIDMPPARLATPEHGIDIPPRATRHASRATCNAGTRHRHTPSRHSTCLPRRLQRRSTASTCPPRDRQRRPGDSRRRPTASTYPARHQQRLARATSTRHAPRARARRADSNAVGSALPIRPDHRIRPIALEPFAAPAHTSRNGGASPAISGLDRQSSNNQSEDF
jgi:hypothetical protein